MNLKARLIERGLKQIDVAATLRVSNGTLSRWINRKTPVPSSHLRPLANILRVPLGELLPPTRKRAKR